ncbi:MAG: Nramp family divalent metal transporter [Candidatus Limnocylindria bacterium]
MTIGPVRRGIRGLSRVRGSAAGRRAGLMTFLAVMGPGIITGFAGNDAGGVATYTAVGAHHGYALLWLLLISTVGLGVIQEMCARMGAVTGKGLSDLIRERFGVRWTAVAMLALLVANGINVAAEYAGIAVSLSLLGVPTYIAVPVAGVAIWALVVFFPYRVVERTLFVLLLAFVAYPITAVLAGPDLDQAARDVLDGGGLVVGGRVEVAALLAALALVGTTITPYMQFYIQASIVDKGIDRAKYHFTRLDVLLGALLTGLNGLFIIVVAAAVLNPAGIEVATAEDAARALGPLAGAQAELLFGVGLFGASLLAATVMPLSTSYAVCEAFGWESGISKDFGDAPVFMGLFTFLLVAGGALVLVFPAGLLIELILVSQAVNGLLLPVILVFILRLAGDRTLMGRDANGPLSAVTGWGIAALASALSVAYVAALALGLGPS